MEYILSLPSENQVTIFAYLPLKDVLSFTCTCHASRELLDDKDISKYTNDDVTIVTQSIWKTLFKRDYSWSEDSSTIQYPSASSTISMKQYYFTYVEDRVAKLVSSLSTEQQKWSDKAYNKVLYKTVESSRSERRIDKYREKFMGTVGYCEENGLSLEDIALIIRKREFTNIKITPCDNRLMELFNKVKKWSVKKRQQDLLTTQIIASALSICGRDVADAEAIENNLRRVYGPEMEDGVDLLLMILIPMKKTRAVIAIAVTLKTSIVMKVITNVMQRSLYLCTNNSYFYSSLLLFDEILITGNMHRKHIYIYTSSLQPPTHTCGLRNKS